MFIRLLVSFSQENFPLLDYIESARTFNHLLLYSPEVKTIYVIRGQEKKGKSANNIQGIVAIVIKPYHKEEM